MRHIEVIVDKWPIGPQNRMHSTGDRIFIDDTAAHILVGMGKCKYVEHDQRAVRSKVMSTEDNEALSAPRRRGRYDRRDMRVKD